MLKILSAQQIRELDAYTIQNEPIASIDLMERACQAFVQWFVQHYDATHKIGIICGAGNNGGDGLGIARLLRDWSYPVSVWIVRGSVKETEDFKINLDRLPKEIKVADFDASANASLSSCDVLIDAIFGSGLSRPPEGPYGQAILTINSSEAVRVAIDIPSGLFADHHSLGPIIHAHHTVSFQLPKLGFLLPENHQYVGEWCMADIGLSKSFLKEVSTRYYYLTRKYVKRILKPRATFDHKGNHGRALLIAGSYGKMGACILAARATLRSGVGLLTTHVPQIGYSIIQSAVPEAMASVDEHQQTFSSPPALDGFDVIGIGPGLGQSEPTLHALRKILEAGKPLVIDADALNLIGARRELLHVIPAGSILTPHPKEFERLSGSWNDDFERLEKQITFSKETRSVVVLKGAHTSITTPDGQVYFNSTGNPGMATGGSGDVLTGILTGLLAQKYSATDAAILGVYLHGLSGDLASREKGMSSLIASDLIDFLPLAFRNLMRPTGIDPTRPD